MDIQQILKLLPHRYPILLVDRVTETVPNQRLVAYKNVSINEPFFEGHFPGHPVMPGVLIVEALAQASALLAYISGGFDPEKQVAYLMSCDNVKFRRPVVPGDRLQLEVTMVKAKGKILKTAAVATVEGQKVAEAELLATVVDREKAPEEKPATP